MQAIQLGNQTTPTAVVDCSPSETPLNYIQILLGFVVPILFTIIVCVGFLGNLLVILVIVSNSQMRSTTNILIGSLAMADLAFIVFCVPFTAMVYAMGGWPLGETMCKIYQFTIYITAYCSVYTLVLMSLDRYLAVVHPLNAVSLRTTRNAVIGVALVWLIFLTVNLPLLLDSGVVYEPQSKISCPAQYCTYLKLVKLNTTTNTGIDNKRFGQIYFGLFFLFGFLAPLIAICALYGFLIARLLFGRTARLASSEAMRSKKRVTRMVVIVVVVFAICWMPIQVVFMVQYFGPDPDGNAFRTIHVISNCLAYANSSINPILYAFLSANFRAAFANFLCARRGDATVANAIKYERTTHCAATRPSNVAMTTGLALTNSKTSERNKGIEDQIVGTEFKVNIEAESCSPLLKYTQNNTTTDLAQDTEVTINNTYLRMAQQEQPIILKETDID